MRTRSAKSSEQMPPTGASMVRIEVSCMDQYFQHDASRSAASATIEQRRHVPAFEFDERRHGGLAGHGKVGVEAVAEPFDLQAVPGQDVDHVQRLLGRREL